MDSTIYLAGKITGDPNYREKFKQAAEALTKAGYNIMSPAILPPTGFTYDAYIRMSAALQVECWAVCFLPDWIESNGAIGEYFKAKQNNQRIFFFEEMEGVSHD